MNLIGFIIRRIVMLIRMLSKTRS